MTTYTCTLKEPRFTDLVQHLNQGNYELRELPHARVAAKGNQVNIVLYESGKLVVQGKGTADWIEFVFEPEILKEPASQPEPATSSSQDALPLPRIGIDESGKGDFFGPMAIAAYHLSSEFLPLIGELGIRDSKRIKSDRKISSIASQLHSCSPEHCEILVLAPETYNALVRKMGSVNRVLAWAHATVLENLLERFPYTGNAVADQFGPEHQINGALKNRGKTITLVQRHRAESDPAVAAASILARHAFVEKLGDLSGLTNCTLPPGATHVRPTAEEIVTRAGPEILTRIAKTHFRTTRQVLEATGYDPGLLGTPEPKVWKRK